MPQNLALLGTPRALRGRPEPCGCLSVVLEAAHFSHQVSRGGGSSSTTKKAAPRTTAGYRSCAERAAALRRYLSTMFQGSSKATATAAAAAAAVAAGVVVGKALSQEDAMLRLRLRLAQFFRGKYTLSDVRVPESLLPRELRGAADGEGLVACDGAV